MTRPLKPPSWLARFAPLLILAEGCKDYEPACQDEQTTEEVTEESDQIWAGAETTWADLVAALDGVWDGTYSYDCDVANCGDEGVGGDWTGSWAPPAFAATEVMGPAAGGVTSQCRAYVSMAASVAIESLNGDFSGSGVGTITAEVGPEAALLDVSLDAGFSVAETSPLAGKAGDLLFYATFLASAPTTDSCAENGSAMLTASGAGGALVTGAFASPNCGD